MTPLPPTSFASGCFGLLLLASVSTAAPASRREAPLDPGDAAIMLFVETRAGDALAPRVVELGGEVVHVFENVDGVAVRLAPAAIAELASDPRVDGILRSRDVSHADSNPALAALLEEKGLRPTRRAIPGAGNIVSLRDAGRIRPVDVSGLASRGAGPVSFLGYEAVTRAGEAGAAANYGEGVLVAIIDSGVYPDHPLYAGNVIGGWNLVPAAEEQRIDADGDGFPDGLSFDWDALENDDHGTFCAGLIAGHAELEMPAADPFAQSIAFHAPESIEIDGDIARVFLAGTAPRASLFAIKIFPYRGGSAPDARVGQALDMLISAKRHGVLDVDVVSMSLSGPVLDDGRYFLDRLVDAATRAGITCVVAASNEGPSQVSVGSPGSARGALTVGATIDPVHLRVAIEGFFGLPIGAGALAYPHELQVVDFSARGLTADGRVKPDLVASGLFAFSSTLVDFTGDGIPDAPSFGMGSGTSFSTPTAAGAAALCAAFAKAEGRFARAPFLAHALIEAAAPFAPAERVSAREQGAGFLRVPEALQLLERGGAGAAPDLDPADPTTARLSLAGGSASGATPLLGPGETFDFYVDVPRNVGEIRIAFPEVRLVGPGNPVLGGDALQMSVHSAKRGGSGDYVFFDGTLSSGDSFVWPLPEAGTFRITAMGSPLNYGEAGVSFEIDSSPFVVTPSRVFADRMKRDEMTQHAVLVPEGLAALGVRLVWEHDWTRLPTYDLDMLVQGPDTFVFAATLDSPELAWIEEPTAGEWIFHLRDFSSVVGTEPYRLELVYIPDAAAGGAAAIAADAARPRILGTLARAGGAHDVRFGIPARGPVAVDVFDVSGRRVRNLARGVREAGEQVSTWDGRDADGARAASGVYFVRVATDAGSVTRKLVVAR